MAAYLERLDEDLSTEIPRSFASRVFKMKFIAMNTFDSKVWRSFERPGSSLPYEVFKAL